MTFPKYHDSMEFSFDSLLEHVSRHRVRKWLWDGARSERSHTLGIMISEISDEQLNRGLARTLSRSARPNVMRFKRFPRR
jgi:hypothetical protein